MRVIFRSPAAPVVLADPRGGERSDAQLLLELVLLDAGEDPTPAAVRVTVRPDGTPSRLGTHSLRSLRERAGGGPIQIPAPVDALGGAPVTIPPAVLSGLADTVEFLVRWQITPRRQP